MVSSWFWWEKPGAKFRPPVAAAKARIGRSAGTAAAIATAPRSAPLKVKKHGYFMGKDDVRISYIIHIYIYGGVHQWGYPLKWLVYDGKAYSNGWIGGTPHMYPMVQWMIVYHLYPMRKNDIKIMSTWFWHDVEWSCLPGMGVLRTPWMAVCFSAHVLDPISGKKTTRKQVANSRSGVSSLEALSFAASRSTTWTSRNSIHVGCFNPTINPTVLLFKPSSTFNHPIVATVLMFLTVFEKSE